MRDWGAETYGDRIADVYDELYQELFDVEGGVAFIAGRADTGPVLELGIGTGRLALPLRAKGVEVYGIDASQAMIDKLRDKPGGSEILVTRGDFADVDVEGAYSL